MDKSEKELKKIQELNKTIDEIINSDASYNDKVAKMLELHKTYVRKDDWDSVLQITMRFQKELKGD